MLLSGFKEDCEARGLTEHTIETYKSNVKNFLQAIPEPEKASQEDLRRYLRNLRARNLQGSTLKGHFAALSTFYEYLIFEGILAGNPILSFRKRYLARIRHTLGGDNRRQLISIETMRELIGLPGDLNVIAMMLFLAKTGMRRGELIAMDLNDIDLETGEYWTKPKAKRTNRIGFLDGETIAVLKEYLNWRENKATEAALWIMSSGKRVTRNYVYYSVIWQASLLAIHDPHGPINKKFTPHCFRHFFTTHLFRAGMKPEFIKWLRGDSMGKEAWQIYNHIDPQDVRKEYLNCIPRLVDPFFRNQTLDKWV